MNLAQAIDELEGEDGIPLECRGNMKRLLQKFYDHTFHRGKGIGLMNAYAAFQDQDPATMTPEVREIWDRLVNMYQQHLRESR